MWQNHLQDTIHQQSHVITKGLGSAIGSQEQVQDSPWEPFKAHCTPEQNTTIIYSYQLTAMHCTVISNFP